METSGMEGTHRLAVVTGSSSGIGLATALRLAAEGCTVIGTVRSEASGTPLLEAAEDADVSLAVMDVDDEKSVTSCLTSILDRFGPIDILVNNAGIAGGGTVEDTSIERYEQLMSTNAWGTLRCIKAVLPSMRERGSGTIINVTSLAARIARGGLSAYNMSKFAQNALTLSLAEEVAPFGLRVAAVEPGIVLTPIFQKSGENPVLPSPPYQQLAERAGRRFAGGLREPAMPEDVAEVIWQAITTDEPRLRWLATPDARREVEAWQQYSDEEWFRHSVDPDDKSWAAWLSGVRGYDL